MYSENNNHFEYKNKAEVEVTACGETHTIYSNQVEAKKVVIRVEKMQNKECVFEGDYLEYTVKICNDSTVVIDDPVFCDDIPDGLDYVPNTFHVDGKPETPVKQPFSNRLTFKLKKLTPNSETFITFKTVVQ